MHYLKKKKRKKWKWKERQKLLINENHKKSNQVKVLSFSLSEKIKKNITKLKSIIFVREEIKRNLDLESSKVDGIRNVQITRALYVKNSNVILDLDIISNFFFPRFVSCSDFTFY